VHAKRAKPPPLPTTAPPSPESGTRPKVSGILRLRPVSDALMFDEVIVFPNGITLIAIEGEPLLRYTSLQAMLDAHGLESHELVAFSAREY
jgi:hypothetical protein